MCDKEKTQVLEKLREYLLQEAWANKSSHYREIRNHYTGKHGLTLLKGWKLTEPLATWSSPMHILLGQDKALVQPIPDSYQEKNHPLLLRMPSKVACQALKDSIKSPAFNQIENQIQLQKTELSLSEKNVQRKTPASHPRDACQNPTRSYLPCIRLERWLLFNSK